MSIDAEITFRNMQPSEAVEERVRERIRWLARYAGRVTSAHVRIEAPHRNRTKGKIYHVRVQLIVPGRPGMVVSQEPEVNKAHENVYIAVRDAFEAARRQLIETNTLRSHRTKMRDKEMMAMMAGSFA